MADGLDDITPLGNDAAARLAEHVAGRRDFSMRFNTAPPEPVVGWTVTVNGEPVTFTVNSRTANIELDLDVDIRTGDVVIVTRPDGKVIDVSPQQQRGL